MAISQFPTSSGAKVDLTSLSSLMKDGYSGVAANTTITLYTYNGKGYVSSGLIYSSVSSYNGALKITCDGTVVYYVTTLSSMNGYGGFFTPLTQQHVLNVLSNTASANQFFYFKIPGGQNSNNAGTFTLSQVMVGDSSSTTNGAGNYASYFPQPFYFNSSLKVELQNTYTSAQNIYYNITGGIG